MDMGQHFTARPDPFGPNLTHGCTYINKAFMLKQYDTTRET